MASTAEAERALAVTDLRAMISYDHVTGSFQWLSSPSQRTKAGDIAGGICHSGYAAISIRGRRYLAHRVAWALFYGEWPVDLIDHIDGDPLNNRIANLRPCVQAENVKNRSDARGYSLARGKYAARIRVDKKLIHLGTFSNEADARHAYLTATAKYFGSFSVLNRRSAADASLQRAIEAAPLGSAVPADEQANQSRFAQTQCREVGSQGDRA